MGLTANIKRATSTGVGIVGIVLWIAAGLVCFVWTLYVLFSLFGIWTIFVGLILAPVTYVASIFIVWFTTGFFPVILLIPYLASFVGIGLMVVGGKLADKIEEER